MFTGIIQQLGTIVSVQTVDFVAVLRVDTHGWAHHPDPGDSIAVNGCCLTVTEDEDSQPGTLRFDVIQQSLRLTTLGGLVQGSPVNLEHAVTPSTMLGGHIVQGHIDGMGTVTDVQHSESESRVRVQPPAELMTAIIEKGSIALDGVSLTVASLAADSFEVALIPTTLRDTTLGRAEIGTPLNLETDYVAKTVVNWLEKQQADRLVVP